MRSLVPRNPRALAGSRRFTRAQRLPRRKLPSGPWTPRHALNFALLRQFARREGHSRVPSDHREGNFGLGSWVNKRRGDYRQGRLTAEQVRTLERLPGWTWSPLEDDFQAGLKALSAFVRREGHAAVPHGHREGSFKLGYWVAVKRIQYGKGRLARERVHVLEALPGWSWRRIEDRFQIALMHLRRYLKREGHARVPIRHREGSFRLGTWMNGIRRSHRLGQLPAYQAKQLQSLQGWTWNAVEELFERGVAHLTVFVRREGHALVPASHIESGFRLGVWVAERRAQFRKGVLAAERIRALQRFPGWQWRVAGARFEEGYRRLAQFVERHGHARVPVEHDERGFPLGAWVWSRRRRRTRMRPDEARRLERLRGWTWTVRGPTAKASTPRPRA